MSPWKQRRLGRPFGSSKLLSHSLEAKLDAVPFGLSGYVCIGHCGRCNGLKASLKQG